MTRVGVPHDRGGVRLAKAEPVGGVENLGLDVGHAAAAVAVVLGDLGEAWDFRLVELNSLAALDRGKLRFFVVAGRQVVTAEGLEVLALACDGGFPDGRPLADILTGRRFGFRQSAEIVVQVAEALAEAHSRKIVHRDLKPSNILIDGSGQPRVTDFGVAKVLRGEDERMPMIQGTPVYMPPEQILGREVDARSDIYAVGTMLFKMLAPELPFPPYSSKTDLLKQKARRKDGIFLKRPSEMNPYADEAIDRIVFKATAYRKEDRYEDCRQFKQDLEAYAQTN